MTTRSSCLEASAKVWGITRARTLASLIACACAVRERKRVRVRVVVCVCVYVVTVSQARRDEHFIHEMTCMN